MHSKKIKVKFLLKVIYVKSQTEERYSTATQSWNLHSTLTKALMLLQWRVNESNRKPRVAAVRAKRANTEQGYKVPTVVAVMLVAFQPS